MEIHEHFMNIAALETTVFEIIERAPNLQDSIYSIITTFIDESFIKLKTRDDNITRHLELLRLLLCQQYKLYFENFKDEKTRFRSKFGQFMDFIGDKKLFTLKGHQCILGDIMVLQLVLFEDQTNFIRTFEHFRSEDICGEIISGNKLSMNTYLQILKCFLQAWKVINFLNSTKESGSINKTHLESCKKVLISSIMYDLQTWIKCERNDEWCTLSSVISDIISITRSNIILTPYVHEILDKKNALTILCTLSHFIFPLDSSGILIDYNLILRENLWLVLQNKLISSDPQVRKEALHLFKRLVDFIDLYEQNIKKALSLHMVPNSLNPFICNQDASANQSIKQLRTNFILIMETLEEKQKHLVIPSLSLIDSLINGWAEHKSCGNCFNFSWIYCVFERILAHDNNSVVKWGLLKSLKLNAVAYNNDWFIRVIVKSLNNTFLYDKCSNESEPEIVIALTSWFNNFQSEDLHLVEKFVYFFYNVSWNPVAIYYILQSLISVSEELNDMITFQQEHLDIIRSIIETNIKLHPPLLHTMSLITLIKILSRFSETQNLQIISNLLTVFPEKIIKEANCWSALKTWLGKVHYENAMNFICQVCQTLAIDDTNVRIPMSTFSIVIQLLYERQIICKSDQCTVTQSLTTLFNNLDKVDVRPYVKISFVIKIIDLIYSLLNLKRSLPNFMVKLFINYKDAIFKFILKLFHNEHFCYECMKVCLKVLQNINYSTMDDASNASIVIDNNNSKELEAKCMQVFGNIKQHNEIQLLFALQVWSNISNTYVYDNQLFLETINKLLTIIKSKNCITESGNIAIDFYTAIGKLIKHHVQTLNINDLKNDDNWIKILPSIIDAVGNQVLLYFGDVIHLYTVANATDSKKLEDIKYLIESMWNCNFDSKRNKIFWSVAYKLTKIVNSLEFLRCKLLQEFTQEINNQILIEGDSLPGLKYILISNMEITQYFNYFMEITLNGLLHGQVFRRDQRIYMQTYLKGKQITNYFQLESGRNENFKIYNFISRQSNIDGAIRAISVIQLCEALHIKNENSSVFLPLVLEKFLNVQHKRYFADSQLHRLKHRIMQVLLLLQPYLDKKSTEILYQLLRDSILLDSDQHSVKMMKEWLLIRIYLSNEELFSDLWTFFDKVCDERPGNASSMIGIIWHIARQLSEEKLTSFVNIALAKLGTCCMGQQYNMRLFGQVFFIKLYELLDENSNVILEYDSFYKATLKSLQCSTFKKNPIKINEDFFYTVFDPINHYSLETIYYQLPRLSNVSFEEWILQETFKEQIFLKNYCIDIRINNFDNLLSKALIPYTVLKSCENSKPEEIECSNITTNIQKKITPWKTTLPNEEELSEIMNLTDLKNNTKCKQSIIVVASLIEKSQNLGGIARTCEIFGVKELVISSLKQIENKEFQVLSVSADKWIKIIEVAPYSLVKYLVELKDCGWTLIGAEQTANSVNLFEFNFPKQSVLMLGNEKHGIPANIIPLLDVCVEISQFGVIRSLNVHVTSAICIWEYVKQYQNVTL